MTGVEEHGEHRLARRALPKPLVFLTLTIILVFAGAPLLLLPSALAAPREALELLDLGWVIAWTTIQAAASATIAVLLGAPIGVAGGFLGARVPRAYRVLGLPVFMAPSVAVVLGFRELEMLGLLPAWAVRAPWGIILVHSYFNIPLAAVLTYASIAGLSRETIEYVESLRLGVWRLLARVIIPAALPGAASAWALTFLYSYTGLAAPLMVEGAAYRYYTLEAWIYTVYWSFPDYRPAASILALLQSLILVAAAAVFVRASLASEGSLGEAVGYARHGKARLILEAYSLVLLAFLYTPLLGVVAGSFVNPYTGEVGLTAYSELLSGAIGLPPGASFARSLVNSIIYALIASTAAILLSIPLVLGGGLARRLAGVSPLVVSPVMVGVSLSLAVYPVLVQVAPRTVVVLLLVVLAHTAMALPLASRSMDTGLGRVPREILAYTASIGLRGWRLAYHLARASGPGLVAGLVLAAASSLGEFGAVLVITDPSTWSLGVMVYKLYAGGRTPHVASAAASVLLLLVLALTWIAARRMREWF